MARAHRGLGRDYDALGKHVAARKHFQHALTLYMDLGPPEADDVRARLTLLDLDLDQVTPNTLQALRAAKKAKISGVRGKGGVRQTGRLEEVVPR